MKKWIYAIFLVIPIASKAQLKVGNAPATIDPSSILELEHPNKALYLSRVSLTSTTDVTTVPSPKAGMMVFNTNSSITGTVTDPIITGGIGVYTYDGNRWVGSAGSGGGSSANAWNLIGNAGTSASLNFIGTTDNNPLNVRTNNAMRATFRADGTMAFTNATPLYADNIVEYKIDNVGGAVTSGEQNQGVNVLSTALNGAAQSIALRGRNNVPAGSTVNALRGVQGNTGVEGTANGGVSGGYFNASLKSTGALGSSATLTGVAADAEASAGGTSASTNTFIGGRFSSNVANATNARSVGVFTSANNSNTSNIGLYAVVNDPLFVNYTGFNGALPTGFSTSILGFNPATAANNYGGYFYGKNRSTLGSTVRVVTDPGAAIPGGTELYGTYSTINGSSSGSMTSLYAQNSNASSFSNNVRTIGSHSEAAAGGSGLGATQYAQAVGATGLANYIGGSDAPVTDYVVGVRGATYSIGNKTNSVNVIGADYGGGYYRSIGGYFLGRSGTDANLGVVAQVGGTENQTWKSAAFAGKNISLVGVNNNAPSSNDLALYTDGGVQMKNLGTTTPTALVGIDAQGNLSTTTLGGSVTADNGLTKTGSNIQLGGSLLHNTTITAGAFNTLVSGANPADGASVLKVENNAGTVADGSDLFAGFNSISGTNNSAVGSFATLRALYNSASTPSNNMRVQGSLNEASTSGQGLGASATPQATGATGLADYVGTSDAPTSDYLVGLRGAAYTSSNKTNGLNIVGQNFGGSYYRSVGGYFYPDAGTDANLGVVAQTGGTPNSGWQAPEFAGKNISVAAINTGNTDNDYAGYFLSSNHADAARSLNVALNPSPNSLAGGGNSGPFATSTILSYPGTENTGNFAGTLGGLYANANTSASDYQAQGALLESSTTGGTGAMTHAIGAFGLVTGNSSTADPKARIIGIGGATNFQGAGNNYNGIAVNGYNAYDGTPTTGKSVGGHFDGTGGATEFGAIGTVGDVTAYQTMFDPNLNGMHIGIAAINHNSPAFDQFALYSEGAVQMKNLTGTGTRLMTIDAAGNVGSATAPAVVPAWLLTGNAGTNPATNFLGTTDNNALNVRTNNTLRATFRPDGTMAFTNSTPLYADNIVEYRIDNVGGATTSGEQNQGVNVLASALNGAALSVGTRSRMNVNSGTTVNSVRGLQGNVGVDGTANGGVSAAYFDAVIRPGSSLGAAATVTGVGADAEATGGTVANTNAFIGGRFSGSAANATAARTYGSFNYANNSVTSNIGTYSAANDPSFAKFLSFRSSLPAGYGAGVVGLNGANGDNQFAADLVSTNSADAARALNVTLSPAANSLAGGGNSGPFATTSTVTYPGTENTGSFAGTVGGIYSNANTTSSDYQAQGILAEAATSGKGQGSGSNIAQVVGSFGLADYNGSTDAGIDDYATGSAGSPYTSSKAINGIGITGSPYSSGYYRMIGGYFRAAGGTVDNGGYHHANIGMVSQVGGTKNQAWRDLAFNDKNIGVIAVNYNTPSLNDLALYTSGAVQMKSLTGTGMGLMTIDATTGAVGSTAGSTSGVTIPAGTTAQQPAAPAIGTIRFNTTTHRFEGYTDDTDTSSPGLTPGWVELSTN